MCVWLFVLKTELLNTQYVIFGHILKKAPLSLKIVQGLYNICVCGY